MITNKKIQRLKKLKELGVLDQDIFEKIQVEMDERLEQETGLIRNELKLFLEDDEMDELIKKLNLINKPNHNG